MCQVHDTKRIALLAVRNIEIEHPFSLGQGPPEVRRGEIIARRISRSSQEILSPCRLRVPNVDLPTASWSSAQTSNPASAGHTPSPSSRSPTPIPRVDSEAARRRLRNMVPVRPHSAASTKLMCIKRSQHMTNMELCSFLKNFRPSFFSFHGGTGQKHMNSARAVFEILGPAVVNGISRLASVPPRPHAALSRRVAFSSSRSSTSMPDCSFGPRNQTSAGRRRSGNASARRDDSQLMRHIPENNESRQERDLVFPIDCMTQCWIDTSSKRSKRKRNLISATIAAVALSVGLSNKTT